MGLTRIEKQKDQLIKEKINQSMKRERISEGGNIYTLGQLPHRRQYR